jgi:hypothetical protein
MEAANLNQIPQRGALQVIVKPGTPVTSAGKSFSISVSITNPYDVPVTIGDVSMVLPFELYDVFVANKLKERREAERQLEATRSKLIRQMGGRAVKRSWLEEGMLRPVLRAMFSAVPILPAEIMTDLTLTAVARVASMDLGYSSLNQLTSSAAQLLEKPKVETVEQLTEEEIREKVNAWVRPLEEEYERRYQEDIEQLIHLQPGDSISKLFTLRTKRGLTFRPSSHDLNILVSYRVDNVEHSQAIPYSLNVQASLPSVIIGAVVGSLFGSLASQPNIFEWHWPTIVPRTLSALILSGFAVIAFARKEGVQPLIAVQDFWGGLLIGFIVGYSGLQVLGDVFGPTNAGGASSP